MGGFGSTRWGGHDKKATVESCRRLDLNELFRDDPPQVGSSGTFHAIRNGVETAVEFEVKAGNDGRPVLELRYAQVPGWAASPTVAVVIGLESTPALRGVRWWGQCPLSRDGQPCGRRVAKLYRPPGYDAEFGCRRCHRLAYASSQERDARVDALVADPKALLRRLRRRRPKSLSEIDVLLRAVRKLERRLDNVSLFPDLERMTHDDLDREPVAGDDPRTLGDAGPVGGLP